MSVVDPGNPNLFTASDFVTQIVDEVNALKQRIIDRVETLQAEDADIRVDYAAADAALNAAIGTALGFRLISPVANLSLPALVPNAALVTGPGGTTLTWDAAYGEFVTNAAALTQAVEDATQAAADATQAAADAQAAVDTGAVSKAATTDQVMNGNLIVQKDNGLIQVGRDDDPSKLVQLRAASGEAVLEYGSGYSRLYISGVTRLSNAEVLNNLVLNTASVAGAAQVLAGGSLTVAAGATLALASPPVNPTDAANKQYVDGPRATALVLPGNAVNPLEAVPLQQIGDRTRFSLYPAVSTASGLRATFTSIPTWAKRLTLNINGVGSTGSTLARLRVRIGSSGGMQTSGYAGCSLVTRNAGATSGTNLATAGIEFAVMTGTAIRCGSLVLAKVEGNVWAFTGCVADSTSAAICTVAGVHTTLAGALDTLDVAMGDGTSEQFNAGSVSLLVEG